MMPFAGELPYTYGMRMGNIDLTIRKSGRSRAMRITVRTDGSVMVTKPPHASMSMIEAFLRDKWQWIEDKVDFFKTHPRERIVRPRSIYTKAHYRKHREAARALVEARLEHFNRHYGFHYNAVAIRNQKTRWGSCSSKRNLNFNYKLLFLAPEQQDYIIVHELCHLAEFSHGPKFWAHVAEQIPDYKNLRKTMRKFRL